MDNRKGLERLSLFGGYQCVFCGGVADTTDHTPPKCLLERPYPADLMTVPACENCNSGFSRDEAFLKAVLAHVSFEEDLIQSKRDGDVARAMEREPRLREEMESHFDAKGYFMPTEEVLSRIGRVLIKTVKGLYFKHYGRIVDSQSVTCLEIDHQKRRSPQDLLREFCDPSPSDMWGGGWPEVTPNPMALERAVAACFAGDGKLSRWKPPVWIDYQPGVFSYTFRQGAETKTLIWALDLHRTLAATVECPWPSKKGYAGGLHG